ISNIIGPISLLGGGYALHREHTNPLKILCESIGMITAETIRPGETGAYTKRLLSELSVSLADWAATNGPVNYVLIDDQAHHGWEEWLRIMLEQPPGAVVNLWDKAKSVEPSGYFLEL